MKIKKNIDAIKSTLIIFGIAIIKAYIETLKPSFFDIIFKGLRILKSLITFRTFRLTVGRLADKIEVKTIAKSMMFQVLLK
jgi:hypothetical protein